MSKSSMDLSIIGIYNVIFPLSVPAVFASVLNVTPLLFVPPNSPVAVLDGVTKLLSLFNVITALTRLPTAFGFVVVVGVSFVSFTNE